jgi:hypothetical protein
MHNMTCSSQATAVLGRVSVYTVVMNDPAASCGVSKRWLRPENQRFSDLKIPFETKQASGNQTHSD